MKSLLLKFGQDIFSGLKMSLELGCRFLKWNWRPLSLKNFRRQKRELNPIEWFFSETLGKSSCSEFSPWTCYEIYCFLMIETLSFFSFNFPSWTKNRKVVHTFLQLHHEDNPEVLLWPSLSITVQKNFNIALSLQVTKFKKYKTWNPKVQLYIVIVLSCPLIGSLSGSTTNQRAAQNNCYIEPDFKGPSICTT